MKNILYFTRTMAIGGTEKVVLQLCKSMQSQFDKIVVCSCGGVNVKLLDEMHIKHYLIDDIEKKNPKVFFNTIKMLLDIMGRENINVVHTHHRVAAFYVRLIKSVKPKLVFIHTAHNTFYDRKALTRFALNQSNVVAVGERVRENLLNIYNQANKKVTVILNGIEVNKGPFIRVREIEKYKNEGYFLVGNVGRITEQKGMEYFVRSVPEVIKINPRIQFFIIGDGEDRLKIEKLVVELNVSEHVTFLGYRNDVFSVMKQLDLIVLTSLWEGFPLAPIEAFCVGKTVLATEVDGTAEIVRNGYNGLLVKPRDSNGIAKSILALANDSEWREQLSRQAYDTYLKEFSFEVFKNRYEIYYQGIISEVING